MTGHHQAADLGPARLRLRLSSLLAAAEDLREEWDTTTELAEHLRTQRRRVGQDASLATVLADLEVLMRASAAFPTTPHRYRSIGELLPAIAQAERAYEDLLRRHLAHAGQCLQEQDQ
ncbi:MAG: hypothetical protein ABI140_19260 [Jatrophihabitantaceae bacterium]